MTDLFITVAAYDDIAKAEADWAALESAGDAGSINISDAALVERDPDGTVMTIHRQSHHGWGKGAVVGAVWGLLFPPALAAGAVYGAACGGLIARMNRSLDRGDIRDLGEAMDAGELGLVAVTDGPSLATLDEVLRNAAEGETRQGGTAEEAQEALNEARSAPSEG